MGEHALLSASGSERWMQCPGSLALSKGLPDKSSKFAEEGTKAHDLAAKILLGEDWCRGFYSDDMIEEVQKYVDVVRDYAQGGMLFVEKRVDYSSFIGVPDSFGTSDTIIISGDGKEITIIDLKYGKGVRVDADNNSQMMLYALGAIDEFAALGESFERVRLVIHQPRLDHLSEWTCTVDELMEFAGEAKKAAEIAMAVYNGTLPKVSSNIQFLFPSEKSCRFCKAKHICPALTSFVEQELESGFDDITETIPVSTIIDNLSTIYRQR